MPGVTRDPHRVFGTTQSGGAFNQGTVFELSRVPEPASLVLLGLGLVGVATQAPALLVEKQPRTHE